MMSQRPQVATEVLYSCSTSTVQMTVVHQRPDKLNHVWFEGQYISYILVRFINIFRVSETFVTCFV